MAGSAAPGTGGNAVVYGHNKKVIFGNLPYLSLGQKIYIKTKDDKIHIYEAYKKDFVSPDKIDLVSPTDHEELTIFTCWGVFDSQRVVIKARPDFSSSPVMACSPDEDSLAVVDPTGWKLPSNWSYNLNPSSVPSSVGSSSLAPMALDAFSKWQDASGQKVIFSQGSNNSATRQAYDGKNIIAWGRVGGSALAVTYTRYYASSGQVVDVDTIFNKKFPWSYSGNPLCADTLKYDAGNVLTHELGHWLGLDDHYTNDYLENTMYGYASKGEAKKYTLTSGDKSGTYSIYQ